jgi:flagellin-specific chaperone FliS
MRTHKTAVSIPTEVYLRAEEEAERLGMNRSQLYARALAEFLDRKKGEGITQQLNDLYAELDSCLGPGLEAAQTEVIPRERWR